MTAVSVKWQQNGTAGGVYLNCVCDYCDFLSRTHFVTGECHRMWSQSGTQSL